MIDEVKGELAPQTNTSYYSRHWRGELSLARSWWLNGVLTLGLCNNLVISAFRATIVVFEQTPEITVVIGLVFIALVIGAYVWAWVGIWRAARNYRSRVWSILARIVIPYGVLLSIASLFQGLSNLS